MLGVMAAPFAYVFLSSLCPSHLSPDVVPQPTLRHTTRQMPPLNNKGHSLPGYASLLSILRSYIFSGGITRTG